METLATEVATDDTEAVLQHPPVEHVNVGSVKLTVEMQRLSRPVGDADIGAPAGALDHGMDSVSAPDVVVRRVGDRHALDRQGLGFGFRKRARRADPRALGIALPGTAQRWTIVQRSGFQLGGREDGIVPLHRAEFG